MLLKITICVNSRRLVYGKRINKLSTYRLKKNAVNWKRKGEKKVADENRYRETENDESRRRATSGTVVEQLLHPS